MRLQLPPMNSPPRMIDWMQSLSDATRVRLLRLLERSELSVAEMCTTLQLPQSTVSRHLRVLADDGWISARRGGTSNWYRWNGSELATAQKKLWSVARSHSVPDATAEQDDARLEQVLDARRSQSQDFFSSAAGKWDRLRGDLFGPRIDAWFFAAALDRGEIVGDLGCGTGLVSHTLAPWVEQIIAVDASQAMLHAARKRLKDIDNVDLRKGELTELPIDAGGLSLAMMALVLPYLSDPHRGLAEAARATRSGGRLIVMDMMPHDRVEYREELGQTWMGFSRSQMEGWMESSGWKPECWLIVPPDPEAKGPQVFVATAVRA